jgi:flavoprotein
MTAICKVCGQPMTPDHGIVNITEGTGVSWWQCKCGRRVCERYTIQGTKKTIVEVTEV